MRPLLARGGQRQRRRWTRGPCKSVPAAASATATSTARCAARDATACQVESPKPARRTQECRSSSACQRIDSGRGRARARDLSFRDMRKKPLFAAPVVLKRPENCSLACSGQVGSRYRNPAQATADQSRHYSRHARKVSLFPIVRMATCMASSYCCSWLKLYTVRG
jgi:hypothetical protein